MKAKMQIILGLITLSSIFQLNAQIYTPSGTIQGTSSSNNVGIGTSNPLAGLHVKRTVDTNGFLISAIFGNAYNHYTQFGGLTGGRIRGSNEGYLVLEGNPNGTGNQNLYLNGSSTSNVLIVKNGGKVGIGTSSPQTILDIVETKDSSEHFITIRNNTIANNSYAGISLINSTAQASIAGARIFSQRRTGSSDVDFNIQLYNGQSMKERLTILGENGNVGIGTPEPTAKLSVNGTIISTEIKVLADISQYPDFVFSDNYKLKPLKELEKYIEDNNHLPDIPKVEEVKEGIALGEMNTKLLQKIEELTLYTIEQQKQIESLKEIIERNGLK